MMSYNDFVRRSTGGSLGYQAWGSGRVRSGIEGNVKLMTRSTVGGSLVR